MQIKQTKISIKKPPYLYSVRVETTVPARDRPYYKAGIMDNYSEWKAAGLLVSANFDVEGRIPIAIHIYPQRLIPDSQADSTYGSQVWAKANKLFEDTVMEGVLNKCTLQSVTLGCQLTCKNRKAHKKWMVKILDLLERSKHEVEVYDREWLEDNDPDCIDYDHISKRMICVESTQIRHSAQTGKKIARTIQAYAEDAGKVLGQSAEAVCELNH